VDISVVCLCVCFCMCVCTVTAYSAVDKAIGVKFARRFISVKGKESHILEELCSPRSPKSDKSTWPARWPVRPIEMRRSLNIARCVDVGLAYVDIYIIIIIYEFWSSAV